MAAAALKTWELENAITLSDPHRDSLYTYPPPTSTTPSSTTDTDPHPWRKDPHHFTSIRISALALLKMTIHARSGGPLEIMGIMTGYTLPHTFIVTDALRLPVEGTETRVNAQAEASEYLVTFLERSRQAGVLENAVGWYHSHPGYGCWLSGIDVSTQMLQQYQDPFVAVVIDPDRTVSAGKVEIGAFRTFPQDYKPPVSSSSDPNAPATDPDGFESIPLTKIDDFGAHSSRYYSLSVAHFKSTLDAALLAQLWEKYWVATLSASALGANRAFATSQIRELAAKIAQVERASARGRPGGEAAGGGAPLHVSAGGMGLGMGGGMSMGKRGDAREKQLEKIVRAGDKIVAEEEAGLFAADVKRRLFAPASASADATHQPHESGEVIMGETAAVAQ